VVVCWQTAATVGALSEFTAPMGWLVVEDIAVPEVKFSDHCGINRSEGALQVHIRSIKDESVGIKDDQTPL